MPHLRLSAHALPARTDGDPGTLQTAQGTGLTDHWLPN